MHWKRTIMRILLAILGIVVGTVLALLMVTYLNRFEFKAIQTTVNGWSTTLKCCVPGNNIFVRDACASGLPAVNLPQEEVYWTTTVDSTGQALNGQHDYILHFPARGSRRTTPPGRSP